MSLYTLRAPGAASIGDLEARQHKVDYFHSIYSKLHRGIIPHRTSIDDASVDELQIMDFVFLAIDSGKSRGMITERLESWRVPFVDVAMGLSLTEDKSIRGTARATAKFPDRNIDLLRYFDRSDPKDELYHRNIQTVDLNMLNAALATIRFKKYFGFYHDNRKELQISYVLSGNSLLNSETP